MLAGGEKMKVALITLHTVSNYGSCLQTYASQSLIESLGHEVEIVNYYRKNNQVPVKTERIFRGRVFGRFSDIWTKFPWLKRGLSVPVSTYVRLQDYRFDKFRDEYLHLSNQYLDASQLLENPPEADVYCTGSDQVWNSVWNEGFEGPYFLDFAPVGKRRIAFSASIGRESIFDWEIPLMKNALSKYYAISMREESGVELVKSLGFPDAQLVLDPTLLLTRDNWDKIATHPMHAGESYVLAYGLNDNPRLLSFAAGVAREYGINLISINYNLIHLPSAGIKEITPDVTDFIGLFEDASYVVTDSFHATAFALNFGIPFTAIAPPRFSTRITSILSLTHTNERLLINYNDSSMLRKPIDFEAVHDVLSNMRDESVSFLRNALA